MSGDMAFLGQDIIGTMQLEARDIFPPGVEQQAASHFSRIDVAADGAVEELGGEIELWLEDEQLIITRSCLVFIPRGMKHCPMFVRRITLDA